MLGMGQEEGRRHDPPIRDATGEDRDEQRGEVADVRVGQSPLGHEGPPLPQRRGDVLRPDREGRILRAVNGRRVDDRDRGSLLDLSRDLLGPRLGHRVHRSRPRHGILRRHDGPPRRKEREHAREMDDPRDPPGGGGGLEHVSRALHVRPEEQRFVRERRREEPRAVEESLAAVERAAEGRRVAEVSRDDLDLADRSTEGPQRRVDLLGAPRDDGDGVPRVEQRRHRMAADQTRRAGDEDLHRRLRRSDRTRRSRDRSAAG